jgi:hypothetical protein
MPVCMYIGMFTLLCVYGPSWVSVYNLTQGSDTVAGGLGVCDGHMSVTRPGDIATGLWTVVQGG